MPPWAGFFGRSGRPDVENFRAGHYMLWFPGLLHNILWSLRLSLIQLSLDSWYNYYANRNRTTDAHGGHDATGRKAEGVRKTTAREP